MLILNVYGTIDSGYWYIRFVLQDHLTVLAIVTTGQYYYMSCHLTKEP